jgi:hypothetical protein
MRSYINYFLLFTVAALMSTACKKGEIVNPNAPTLGEIIKNPTVGELNNLVTGTESGMRNSMDMYYDLVSVFGREYYRFSSSEPSYTQDLLGAGSAQLDNTSFYCNTPLVRRYNTIRNAYTLMEGVKNAKALTTDKQRKGYYGFAKTIIAYQLLLNLNLVNDNGLRTDVKDFKDRKSVV